MRHWRTVVTVIVVQVLITAACSTDASHSDVPKPAPPPATTPMTSLATTSTNSPVVPTAPRPATCVLDLAPVTVLPDDPLARFFDRTTTVFGLTIAATPGVPAAALVHATAIAAEYLDNDENCEADDPAVALALAESNALLPLGATADEFDSNAFFDSELPDIYGMSAVLGADETAPPDSFDAALEEILHTIQVLGYAPVHRDLGFEGRTLLTEAMDLARGGPFDQVPAEYPQAAWYHYDDTTCEYECMAVEYFYWGLTTLLGAQSDRCPNIAEEWEPCTAELLTETDQALYALLTEPGFKLPTRLPDGAYTPASG